jgi:phosphoribosyl-ATP pyrophosphohydrolase/phosphoribosyl-AMP cyclohydrolase
MELLHQLVFDDQGLIPAIVQDYFSGEVLTLAFMNEESLRISIEEQRTCFYSRSRKTLWRKGESSGNVQHIVRILTDCDFDSLVIQVIKDGPACHEGLESCFHHLFFEGILPEKFSLDDLYHLIQKRKETMPAGSYTTYLFEKGREKILKKVGEECSEVIISAMKSNRQETIYESADLAYHLLVLLSEMNILPEEIRNELSKRHIIDKKTKQEIPQ